MYVDPRLPGYQGAVPKGRQKWATLCGITIKALEGLKQLGNLFQSLNTRVLKEELGFKQLEMEPTIFVKHSTTFLLMILVWIDDYAVAYYSVEALQWFLGSKTELNIKDEGNLKTFIGLEIDQTPNEITICQGTEIHSAISRIFPQASWLPSARLCAHAHTQSHTGTCMPTHTHARTICAPYACNVLTCSSCTGCSLVKCAPDAPCTSHHTRNIQSKKRHSHFHMLKTLLLRCSQFHVPAIMHASNT